MGTPKAAFYEYVRQEGQRLGMWSIEDLPSRLWHFGSEVPSEISISCYCALEVPRFIDGMGSQIQTVLPSRGGIISAINGLKWSKAAGLDWLPAELSIAPPTVTPKSTCSTHTQILTR